MKVKFKGVVMLLLAFVVQITFGQEKMIFGVVSDEIGPLAGVYIIIEGTEKGGETNIDGKYTLKANKDDVLVYSYMGKETQKVKVGISNKINVVMELSEDNVLDKVVIVALGTKTKPKEITYARSTIKAKDITETKAVNIATAMAGKISGLQINTQNNGVNPTTKVVLRGNRSLLNGNEALVVIDGYPSSRGALDRINSDDVLDVTILKGANGAAIYGSAGTNGVILVRTKMGNGKLKINLSSTTEATRVAYLPEVQEIYGSGLKGKFDPLENVNWGSKFDGHLVRVHAKLPDSTEWKVPFTPIKNRTQDFFSTGITSRNGLSLSGGNDLTKYFMSLDHSNTTGIIPKDKFQRTSVRLKGAQNFGKLKTSGNFKFYKSTMEVVSDRIYQQILNTPLHVPISKMKNWRYGKYTRNETSFYRFTRNPYFLIDTHRKGTDYNDFTFIGNAQYDFTDKLNLSLTTGYTSSMKVYKIKKGALNYAFKLRDKDGKVSENYTEEYNSLVVDEQTSKIRYNSDLILRYNTNLTENFSFKGLVGGNSKSYKSDAISVSGYNLTIPNFFNVSVRGGDLYGSQTTYQYTKLGLYSQLDFGYKNFLYLSVTGRNDWTSTLPKGKNNFFYPGVGTSFVVSDAFPSIKSKKGVSYLKTTFNISKAGTPPPMYGNADKFYLPDNFPYDNAKGLSQSQKIYDKNLRPEFTTSLDVGIEYGLFRNRITGSVSAYKTNTVDQIIPINVAPTAGAYTYLTNIGEIEVKGFETDITVTPVKTKTIKWDVSANYTNTTTRVLKLVAGLDELSMGYGFPGDAEVMAQEGEIFPLLKTSVWKRDPQGRVVVGKDGNPIKDAEMKVQGRTTPPHKLGFSTRFKYKDWSLYAHGDYRTGHVFYNSMVQILEFTGQTPYSASTGRESFVYPNSSYEDGNGGYTANTNRLTTGGGKKFWDGHYKNVKENYVMDASALKIREISLAYTLPRKYLAKSVKSLRISTFGRNLFTFKAGENVYTDPEFSIGSTGIGTSSQTPPTRQFGLNISLTL